MGLIEDIAKTVGVRLNDRGGLQLVSADDALLLVEACRTMGVRVLGIEGFRVSKDVVEPDMEAILDLSDALSPAIAIAASERFIRDLEAAELLFDLTIDD